MKAIVIHRYGGPEELRYEEYRDPSPGKGEVLLRNAAVSVNPVDTMDRRGMNDGWRPLSFPAVIGWDASGTVEDVGEGVTDFVKGDRVCGWGFATYAERCVMKAEYLTIVPDDVDLVDAAALPLVTTTGYQLISVASGVKAGQTVLVSGALGGVGRSAVFAAMERGAVVIAGVTTRSLDKAKELGVERVVALDDAKAFADLEQVDVVANTVRGDTAENLMAKVKPNGTFASVTGAPNNAHEYPNVRVVDFVSRQDATLLEHIVAAVHDGRFKVPVDTHMNFADASAAHAAVEKGGAGKIVLVP